MRFWVAPSLRIHVRRDAICPPFDSLSPIKSTDRLDTRDESVCQYHRNKLKRREDKEKLFCPYFTRRANPFPQRKVDEEEDGQDAQGQRPLDGS